MKTIAFLFLAVISSVSSIGASVVEVRNTWPVTASLKFLVGSHARLKKGDVIAVRDADPLIAEINRLTAVLENLRVEESALRAQLDDAKAFAKDGDPALRANLEQAQAALDRYLTNEGLLARLSLQQAAADATTAFGNQTVRFNARDKMLQEGFIQKTEYDMEEARFNSSKLARDTALARLEKFDKIEKPKAVQDLQKKVDAEKNALQRAELQSQVLIQQLPPKIEDLDKRMGTVRDVLAQNLRFLAEIAILAPADGVFALRSSEVAPPLAVNSILGPNELLGTLTAR